MNHKSSWAEENRSPRKENYSPEQGESSVRRIISAPKNENEENSEILIVVSKLKHYIKEKHDLNTAGNVMEVLTRIIKKYVDGASANAKREGRKTLMDRDFE